MELQIFKIDVSIIEIKIINIKDKKVKIKCFEKRNNNLCLNVRQPMMRSKKMKNNPRENKIKKQKKIFLSIFLQ